MYNETVQRLEKFSDPSEFERLGCDLLSRLGYRGIEPQGVGKKDAGKDALHFADSKKTVIHFSLRKDWNKKIEEDLETTVKSGGKYNKFVFVTNRSIPPYSRDKIKENIKSNYGWEPVIIDQETLRVELDNHARDLRNSYLGIPLDYKSETDSIIDEFIEKRDECSNYITSSRFQRILLLSIPENLYGNRMKLFDEKMKFVGDEEKLKAILGSNLPRQKFDSKVTSNSFSTFHINYEKQYPLDMSQPIAYEANLYQNGIVEIMFDVSRIDPDLDLIKSLVLSFFETINRLYDGFIAEDEYAKIVVCFINAGKMSITKEDGSICQGEKYYFNHDAKEKLKDIFTEEFQEKFIMVLDNKINNFFNK